MANIKKVSSLVSNLSKMNPLDPEIVGVVERIASELDAPSQEVAANLDVLMAQVEKLHTAAVVPASNYSKVASITNGIAQAIELSRRPQYASVRPRIANIVQRLAGIFSECDLAEDMSAHTLEEIEQAVHKLYSNGALNKPNTYYFQARGKGHHGQAG
jgi:hypothetical protein